MGECIIISKGERVILLTADKNVHKHIKKKKLIPKFHGYLWMPVYVHMQMCFCFRVPVFEIPGRLGRQ